MIEELFVWFDDKPILLEIAEGFGILVLAYFCYLITKKVLVSLISRID